MCLSNHPENRVPFGKPEDYDPKQYALFARILDTGWNEVFEQFDILPTHKTDTNNHGPFNTDNIGMGSYTMDSHNVQRYITPEGYVQNEGDIGVRPKKPYHIAYGSITPKRDECQNLLVPVAVSSSHIAYGSIRMEPVFMILGQSAGTAAALSIDDKVAVQDLDYQKLRKQLIADGQRLTAKQKTTTKK